MAKDQNLSVVKGKPGWHSRGYLPHFEAGPQPQMVTFRLYDSLPKSVLRKFDEELLVVSLSKRECERRNLIEKYLDSGAGNCVLSDATIAQTMEQNLLFFDSKRYILHAWIIMPNHVHALLTPSQGYSLSSITHSWKSYTAKRANSILGKEGFFWQREYFDRLIRDKRHFSDAVDYIHNNPVKAGLCGDPVQWQFSSARLFVTNSEFYDEHD